MNYLLYLLKAKDQYNLHSPYLFSFYNELIASKINRNIMVPSLEKDEQIIYKIINSFQPQNIFISKDIPTERIKNIATKATKKTPNHNWNSKIDCAIINHEWNEIRNYIGPNSVIIQYRPHKNIKANKTLETLKSDPKIKVTIDMYYIAIALPLPHLHKQNLILR
jgi:hypothetical protein